MRAEDSRQDSKRQGPCVVCHVKGAGCHSPVQRGILNRAENARKTVREQRTALYTTALTPTETHVLNATYELANFTPGK